MFIELTTNEGVDYTHGIKDWPRHTINTDHIVSFWADYKDGHEWTTCKYSDGKEHSLLIPYKTMQTILAERNELEFHFED